MTLGPRLYGLLVEPTELAAVFYGHRASRSTSALMALRSRSLPS